MSRSALLACIRKELLLLGRDLHGLALLFLMPLAFVLIMSLALQDQFATQAGAKLAVLVTDADHSPASADLVKTLTGSNAFRFVTDDTAQDATLTDRALRRGDYAFAVLIAHGYAGNLLGTPAAGAPPLVTLSVAPDTSRQMEAIFEGSVRAALGRARMGALLLGLGGNAPAEPATDNAIGLHYAYASDTAGRAAAVQPTAVQQSVPAWLVFGAFFVVVPLSNTLIRERQQGTLRRLRSTNLGTLTLLLGKLVPYFLINQLQVVIMLLAGRYLVPLLGGQALQINGAWWLLAIMAAALSCAALGLALLVAVTSRTTEQATLLSGTGNIVLAALGGIMIPKFVMPAAMQSVAAFSPMSWGLEGFLDVLLRGGGLREIAPEAGGLTALGLATILLAWLLQSRRSD